MVMVCTFTAVHRGETLPSVHRPAGLGGNPKVSHHTCVHPVPAGQDHLRGPRQMCKAYVNGRHGSFCAVICGGGVEGSHCGFKGFPFK